MIVASSPWLASIASRLRLAILILAAQFVAHDAVYVARFGVGGDYARAMSAMGHDAYWAPVSILLTAAVALITLTAVAGYLRLRGTARRAAAVPTRTPGPSYLGELRGLWVRLLPTVAILFAIQENVEHLAVEGYPGGVASFIGEENVLVLPVLAATTFILAAVGAIVRWRIRLLAARVAAAIRQPYARARSVTRSTRWGIVAAIIAHRLILDRRDAGRAPPRDLHAMVA